MKLFDRLPQSYQYASVVMLTAVTMVSVGLFVNALLPSPERTSPVSNAEDASGIAITPVNPSSPNSPSAESSTLPGAAVPTDPAPQPGNANVTTPDAPLSSESRASVPGDIDAYAEPYDDLATTNPLGDKYNHLPYAEADPSRLESVGLFVRESYEREEALDYEASAAFAQMRVAAAADGVSIMPISGFRTIARQSELFAKQTEKLGSESAAAELSAPPGYSEHHTGYAIDIGDINSPDTDIKYSFENTPAYAWLVANARRYGFEQSFPYANQQGVSFEPWHWRYVGSARASEIFSESQYRFPIP